LTNKENYINVNNMKNKIILLSLILLGGCSQKTQIMGGFLCDCGRDLPVWRNKICPACFNYDKRCLTSEAESDMLAKYY